MTLLAKLIQPLIKPLLQGLIINPNLITINGDYDDSGWVEASGASLVDNGDGSGTAILDGSRIHTIVLSGVSVAGRSFVASALIKGAGSDIGKDVRLILQSVSGGSSTAVDAVVTLTAAYQRVQLSVTGAASNTGWGMMLKAANSNIANGCIVSAWQIHEIT